MIRQIAEWIEEKDNEIDEAIDKGEESTAKILTKAAGLGFLEGTLDGCLLMGAILSVAGWCKIIGKAIKK